MVMMKSPLIIDYYTDVLCVWAWIAQRRIDELEEQWNEKIELRAHYLDLFGDTATRIGDGWQERGGFEAFGKNVVNSASAFENAPVNQDIWKEVRPATSANAHLLLKAIELTHSAEISFDFSRNLRQSFFVDLLDIGSFDVLYGLAQDAGLDVEAVQKTIEDGTAMAALMQDYQKAKNLGLKGSPSWVMNEGRQILYGNVGYRILNANVKELMVKHSGEASWC